LSKLGKFRGAVFLAHPVQCTHMHPVRKHIHDIPCVGPFVSNRQKAVICGKINTQPTGFSKSYVRCVSIKNTHADFVPYLGKLQMYQNEI